MFDLFKKNENKGPSDVKVVRDVLLRFLKRTIAKSGRWRGPKYKRDQYLYSDRFRRKTYLRISCLHRGKRPV